VPHNLTSSGPNPTPTSISIPAVTDTSTTTSTPTSTPTIETVTSDTSDSKPVSFPTPLNISQYYDWSFTPLSEQHIIFKAPEGYSHIIVTIHIKNNGYKPISTDPSYWKFISDGVSYSYDNANTDLIPLFKKIEHGEEATIQIIYLVQGVPMTGSISYSGL
jgi:hypothetical protein